MKKIIEKELNFINNNAELLRNNYDPVIFEFDGYEEKYCVIMEFTPLFSIQIDLKTKPEMHFMFLEGEGYNISIVGVESRKMNKNEEKIFKSFIDKIYQSSKDQHDSWYK